jgi:hypothetical protein
MISLLSGRRAISAAIRRGCPQQKQARQQSKALPNVINVKPVDVEEEEPTHTTQESRFASVILPWRIRLNSRPWIKIRGALYDQ